MNSIQHLSLALVLAVTASAAVAQGSMSPMDCSKAAKQKHDHAAESGRGTPQMQAHPCPADKAASGAGAKKKAARHDHPATK